MMAASSGRRRRVAAFVLIMALLGTMLISAPASADAATFAALVNAERARHGLPAYALVAELNDVAEIPYTRCQNFDAG